MPSMSRVDSLSNRRPVERSQNGLRWSQQTPGVGQQIATPLCAVGGQRLSQIRDESFMERRRRRDEGTDNFCWASD